MAKTVKQAQEPEALEAMPGYFIRRLHQIAVGRFAAETSAFEITPVQWAALNTTRDRPEIDQRTLARLLGFDTSTIGGVIDRLERRGLMERRAAPSDRRVRRLVVTAAGAEVLEKMRPQVVGVQDWLLAPLSTSDAKRFMQMLRTLVEANTDASRAPCEPEP